MNSEYKDIIKNGIIFQNPVFVQVLGCCPTLAVSTSIENGIGMGLAVIAVLVCSNIVISMIRKLVPDKIRIAVFIVVIASFVTAVEMLMNAYTPDLAEKLGIFIPLIVVNCIVFARAEAFASKFSVGKAALDGLASGMGFTIALIIISAIREFLGSGTLLGFKILGDLFIPSSFFILPAGAFLVLGLLIAGMQAILSRRKEVK